MKKILFVCIENSNRSQMAEAFANMYGNGFIRGYSAGSNPSGKVNPKAIAAMEDLGYDLTVHTSKSVEEIKSEAPFDAVITMGCGDACPWMPAKQHIDWKIRDPKEMGEADFGEIRDEIGRRVKALLQRIRAL